MVRFSKSLRSTLFFLWSRSWLKLLKIVHLFCKSDCMKISEAWLKIPKTGCMWEELPCTRTSLTTKVSLLGVDWFTLGWLHVYSGRLDHSSRFVLFFSFWRLFTIKMVKSVKVFPISFWKIIIFFFRFYFIKIKLPA